MAPLSSVPGDIPALAKSFERYLRAADRSPRTVETYLEAVEQLARFLADRGMPTDAAAADERALDAHRRLSLGDRL